MAPTRQEPCCWKAAVNLAALAARQQDLALAERTYRHVLRCSPHVPQAWYSLAFTRMLQAPLAPHLYAPRTKTQREREGGRERERERERERGERGERTLSPFGTQRTKTPPGLARVGKR